LSANLHHLLFLFLILIDGLSPVAPSCHVVAVA
jgi:hypothetical protein